MVAAAEAADEAIQEMVEVGIAAWVGQEVLEKVAVAVDMGTRQPCHLLCGKRGKAGSRSECSGAALACTKLHKLCTDPGDYHRCKAVTIAQNLESCCSSRNRGNRTGGTGQVELRNVAGSRPHSFVGVRETMELARLGQNLE